MKSRDPALLFATRILRLFSYGSLSVILALYLAETGLDLICCGLHQTRSHNQEALKHDALIYDALYVK